MIFYLLLLFTFPLQANKHDEMYHAANKALKMGQYQEALKGYELLTPQGPVTYYNTGIALYHLKEYGKAIASWSKAEQYASPGLLKKINYNKNKAYQKLGIEGLSGWQAAIFMIQSYFSLFLLQMLFLLTWLGYWFAGYVSNHVVKKYRILLLIISVMSGCLLACKYWVHAYKRVVIIVAQAKMFTGPNADFDIITEIKEGELVSVVQKENTWYKVNCHNTKGWIQSVDVEEVN